MKRALRWPGLIILAALLLVGCSQKNESAAPAVSNSEGVVSQTGTKAGIIVAFGDSLTEGQGVDEAEAYPALLQKKLEANGYNYEVINAGSSGETSSGALSRVDWVLSSLTPDIVILETGGNDSLRGIDLTLTEQNIDRLINQIQGQGSQVVLAGMQTIQNMGQSYTEPFKEIYPTLAQKYDVILIPFFLEGAAAQPTLNQADGIHPTAAGYEIIVENIYPYVVQAIKQDQAN